MWLEEEAVHVGQLHLIIVEQQQLQGRKSQTQQKKKAWQSVTAELRHVSRGYAIGFPTVLEPALHTTGIQGLRDAPLLIEQHYRGAPRYRLAKSVHFFIWFTVFDTWHYDAEYILDLNIEEWW